MAELLRITGYSQRAHFRSQHLEPLLRAGILRMTIPDKPRSSAQRYVLTENGIRLKAWRALNNPTI
jgi:ATP-dependent DNA helicase RecG